MRAPQGILSVAMASTVQQAEPCSWAVRWDGMSLAPCLPCRYSAMKEYLSELDKETKKALETFYGFSEGKSKVRRSVDEWNSTGSDFFQQIPLLKVEDFFRTGTDLHSGQKRKIEGSVFHKDSSIVNSGDSNDIIGFQLVSVAVPWPASSLWGSKGLFGVSVPPQLLLPARVALLFCLSLHGCCRFISSSLEEK